MEPIPSSSPYYDLLSPAEIKASIDRMISTLGITPDKQDMPKFVRNTYDDWYVEVDDAYHLIWQERGSRDDRLTTRDLNALQYQIMRIVLDVSDYKRAENAVAGISWVRIRDLRVGELMRRLDPEWGRRWEAEVAERVARWSYNDDVPADQGRWPSLSVSQDPRFYLGIDLETGQLFLGLPVSNRMVDYIEYYVIDRKRFEEFRSSHEAAVPFVVQACARELDHLLIMKPGTDRGAPC